MPLRIGLLLVVLCLMPAVAQGQDEEVRERLYNFDDMLIDGEFRTPQGMLEQARGETDFGGVLFLKRSYLDRVSQDVAEPVMRP